MNKTFLVSGKEIKVEDYLQQDDRLSFSIEGKKYSFSLVSKDGHSMILDEDGKRFNSAVGTLNRDGEAMVISGSFEAIVSEAGRRSKKTAGAQGGLTSPMPGKIFKVLKEVGSEVKKGEAILILEAMKMEHSIRSDKDGVVNKIHYSVGQLVQGGVVLAEVGNK